MGRVQPYGNRFIARIHNVLGVPISRGMCRLPDFDNSSLPVFKQACLNEFVKLARLDDGDVHDTEHLFGRERDATSLLNHTQLLLCVEGDREEAGAECLFKTRGVEERRSVLEEGEREAEGCVVH